MAASRSSGSPTPHQVARFVHGQQRCRVFRDPTQELVTLSDGDAADGVARQVHRGQGARTLAAQLRVDAALHDAEKGLPLRPVVHRETPLHPVQRAPDTGACHRLIGRVGSALVEGHDDVGAECVLDLDRALGREVQDRAVHLVAEAHALVADFPFWQREHLEAAAIREDGSLPGHHPVQAAEFRYQLLPRAKRQVVGVGQHHLRAGGFHLLRRHGLDGPVGADGHEGGGFDRSVGSREGPGACEIRSGLERMPKGVAHLAHPTHSHLARGRGPSGRYCARRNCAARAGGGAWP